MKGERWIGDRSVISAIVTLSSRMPESRCVFPHRVFFFCLQIEGVKTVPRNGPSLTVSFRISCQSSLGGRSFGRLTYRVYSSRPHAHLGSKNRPIFLPPRYFAEMSDASFPFRSGKNSVLLDLREAFFRLSFSLEERKFCQNARPSAE